MLIRDEHTDYPTGQQHLKTLSCLCARLCNAKIEGDNFLDRVITEDEARIPYHEPETKRRSIQWKHTLPLGSKKIHVAALCRKTFVDSVL